MNKTKRELYEENKKLKEELKAYKDFWQIDEFKKINVKNILFSINIILLLISIFLMVETLK